jgi:hypothetical protein
MPSRALTLVSDTGRDVTRRDMPPIDDESEDYGFELEDLVARFEESEDSSFEAREQSTIYKKFYDGDQLTEEERTTLRKRGQPEVETNLIKPKIDFLIGLEKQQRTKPKALPRTPKHEQDAEACSDALNFVVDDSDYKMKRSGVWEDMLIYGTGGVEVEVRDDKGSYANPDEICIEIRRYRWDRLFVDPHSMEKDCSDAAYFGSVIWMEREDAIAKWPRGKKAIDDTIDNAGAMSDTYDDKPTASVWADRKRKRVRVVKMWILRDEVWYDWTFTKSGILNGGKSPYKTDDDQSDGGMAIQSAYVSWEGWRYSVIKQFLSPQKEYNKRGSKSLHLLSTTQIMAEKGAVSDVEKTRREAARADGYIEVNPDFLAENRFSFRERTDLATGHIKLMEIAREAIQLMGPNAAMQGDQGNEASGRAIMASQQGGMIELGSLLDDLRHFDRRVYHMVWNRIRQYWTGQRWIRVTDDERNVRFAAINQPATIPIPHPTMPGQMLQIPDIDPQTGQQRIQNDVAQSDVDIYIDDVADVVAPQIEQWQALVELKKVDVNNELPFKTLIKAAPNIKNKDQIIEEMEKREQQAAQQGPPPDPHQQAVQAAQAKAQIDAQARDQAHQQQLVQGQQTHQQKLAQTAQEHQLQLDLQQRKAESDNQIEIGKAKVQAATQAHLAEQKQQHDLVGEARKQEVVSHYEGQRHQQSLQHENVAANLKHHAAVASDQHKLHATAAADEHKLHTAQQSDAQKQESAQVSDRQKLDTAQEAAKAKAKAANDQSKAKDAAGGVSARLERQLASMAKAIDRLAKKIDGGNREAHQRGLNK